MSYWSEVRDVALKGIDIALSNFKTTAEQAIEKGKDGVAYLQLKKDLFMEQRNLQVLLADLGDITNELYKSRSDITGNERVKEIVEKIAFVEEKCRSIEAEMKKISGK
ncbi:MAG: hypothetical protein GXY14_04375 [Spirochaetes bacterium]|nr:hypothetical protein [Spirochaetota bacterium]